MDEGKTADLTAELVGLEEEEARVSAERRHLHRQIDFGYATQTTRERERELSDHRRELHVRIDAIRERLGMRTGPRKASFHAASREVPGGIEGLERIGDAAERLDATADDSPLL
jgi:hypothetical protein